MRVPWRVTAWKPHIDAQLHAVAQASGLCGQRCLKRLMMVDGSDHALPAIDGIATPSNLLAQNEGILSLSRSARVS